MTPVIALMALAALGLTEAPVHEPVHGRRQAICVVVTQRSGRDSRFNDSSSDDPARGDPGRGPLRTECRIIPHLDQGGACGAAGRRQRPAAASRRPGRRVGPLPELASDQPSSLGHPPMLRGAVFVAPRLSGATSISGPPCDGRFANPRLAPIKAWRLLRRPIRI